MVACLQYAATNGDEFRVIFSKEMLINVDIIDFEKMVNLKDKFFRYACDMCILQIGELTTKLTEDFKEKNSEIEWRTIKGLRNIHVHEYEKIDFEEMLKILQKDIPDLKEKLQKILEKTD